MLLVVSKYDIIKPGGSLTLTSGTGAMKPGVTASIGGSLNAGLFTMTQGLANELTEKKIRVNCAYTRFLQSFQLQIPLT
jgi:NAD(P)-dependent dehydrogenase (short-subunit alcohol dehydrogenase family)